MDNFLQFTQKNDATVCVLRLSMHRTHHVKLLKKFELKLVRELFIKYNRGLRKRSNSTRKYSCVYYNSKYFLISLVTRYDYRDYVAKIENVYRS